MQKILLTLLFALEAFAGTANETVPKGSLKLHLTSQDGLPVSQATVTIINTSYASFSDASGEVIFSGVPIGKYTLVVSSIGYSSISKPFEIIENKTTDLALVLLESSQSLDEVVVSAERVEKNTLETPVSITVLNAKNIKAARIWRFDDLAAISPNVQVSPSGGGYYNFTVRGINSFSKIPAVISYIDDVPIFNGYIIGYNMQDMEKIEFLRGPQGTLFGRGASAGVLTLQTKKPSNQFGGFAEVSLGNYHQQRYNAGIRIPLIKNHLFMSASGVYTSAHGFFTNTFDQTRVGDNAGFGGNLKLTYLPNNNWMFNYDLRGESTDESGSYLLSSSKEEALKNPYKVNVDRTGGNARKFLIHSLAVNYFGKKINLKSVSAYQHIKVTYKDWDLDDSPLDYQYYSTSPLLKPTNYFTQEVKLSNSNTADKLNWIAGLFYLNTVDRDALVYHYGSVAPPLDLGGGNTIPAPYKNLIESRSVSNSYAVFGQLSYQLFSKTSIQAGLRYEYEKASLDTRTDLLLTGQNPITILPQTKKETNFSALSPKFSLVHILNEQSTLFGTYTRGYRPGGVNPYSSEEKYLAFAPEFSNNFEIGYKLKTTNNKLRLSMSAFLVKLQDQQIYTLTSGFNFATINVGTIQSQGVESELSFIPAKGFQIDWNTGLVKARFLKLPYFIANAQGGLDNIDLISNEPIQTPRLTSFLALNYFKGVGNNSNLSARIEWKYTGHQYFDYLNSISQGAFSLFNTRVSYTYKKTEFAIWGRNLANKHYIAYAYPFLLTGARLADPLTWGVTLSSRF